MPSHDPQANSHTQARQRLGSPTLLHGTTGTLHCTDMAGGAGTSTYRPVGSTQARTIKIEPSEAASAEMDHLAA